MKINIKDINISPDLSPNIDRRLVLLIKQAAAGKLPVYFAAVPLVLCVPYDFDYRPDLHPIGEQAIRKFVEDAKANKFPRMLVYPRGKWFVVADHYIELFSTFEGLPAYAPCWILGKPDNEHIRDLQGPITQDGVMGILGMD